MKTVESSVTMGRPTLSATLAVLLVAAAAVRAEVKVKVLDDGTKVIYNETSDQHARRLSSHLVEVPSIEVGALIERYSRRNNLDPRLVQAVMQVESGYNARALSSKGAMGLMQLMPETARLLGVACPFDPRENVLGGTRYLRRLRDRLGSWPRALAAYHAGAGRVESGRIPEVTRRYVRDVLRLWRPGRTQAADLG